MEVEGIAPDGTWTTVECSKGGKGPYSRPLIDICRLELRANGPITKLIKGTKEDTPRTVSNPVMSPDGKWVAFQEGDASHGDWGTDMASSSCPSIVSKSRRKRGTDQLAMAASPQPDEIMLQLALCLN